MENIPQDSLLISFSQFALLEQCERKWFYKYIRLIPEPIEDSKYLVLGKALHGAFERTLAFLAGQVATTNDAKKAFLASLERTLEEIEDVDSATRSFVEERIFTVVPTLTSLVAKYSHVAQRQGIEKYVQYEVPRGLYEKSALDSMLVPLFDDERNEVIDWIRPERVIFRGYVDLFTSKGDVIDWKTGRPSPQKIQKYSKQIQTYAYVLRELGETVRSGKVVFIENGSEIDVPVDEGVSRQIAEKVFRSLIDAYERQVQPRLFKKTKNEFACKWCGYAWVCQAQTSKTLIPLIRNEALGGLL